MKKRFASILLVLFLAGCTETVILPESSSEAVSSISASSGTISISSQEAISSAASSTVSSQEVSSVPVSSQATSSVVIPPEAPCSANVAPTLPSNFGKEGGVTVDQLKVGTKYVGYAEKLCSLPNAATQTRPQGVVFDGSRFYMTNFSNDKPESRVILSVFDDKGNLIRTSEKLDLDHANSLTYVPKKNALYVASCQSNDDEAAYYRYSVIDIESLTIVEQAEKEKPFFALGYSSEKNMFGSGQWSGETLDIWDGDFNHITSVNVLTHGTLSQGVYCTDEGIWFIRSHQKGYVTELLLYDWEGHLLHEILLPEFAEEAEDIVYIQDGTFWFASKWTERFMAQGANIWSVKFYELEQ